MHNARIKVHVQVRHLVVRLLSLVVMGLAAFAVGPNALAQVREQPVPASLIEIALVSQSPTESYFRLTLAPKVNGSAVVGSDPYRPAVGIALTSRGNAAVVPAGLNGLVHALVFEQIESVLVVRFIARASASVKLLYRDERTLDVVVSVTATQASRETEEDSGQGKNSGSRDANAAGEAFELVMLKYADVSEVVGLLTDGLTVRSNDVFTPREPAFGSNSLTGSSYNPVPLAPPPGSDDRALGQSVDNTIAVDRRLNAVWLKGSREQIERMKDKIALIDVPADTVILETELVELTDTGSKAVGIEFANANGQIGIATFQTGQYIPPGYPPNDHGVRLTSAALQASVFAQVQKGEGKIISKPRIASQSGSTAKIITGDALPILTSITLSGVNGVSQQVQYVNVGVTLQIAPRVSADGYVTSHIFCVVSSVSGYSQGYPTISQREAETSVSVKDGEAFVIGGLSQDSSLKSSSKVPLLGDLPFVGGAFRTDRVSKARTELYIVVTPHIVRRIT